MKKFAALLSLPWSSSEAHSDVIFGHWAEDGSPYEITAPSQLVDSIVAMQNYVYDLNVEVEDREHQLAVLTKELEEMKRSRGYY